MSNSLVSGFGHALDSALFQVRQVLDLERTKGLSAASEAVQHTYDDKYFLAEQFTTASCVAILSTLSTVGLSQDVVQNMKKWSETQEVSIQLQVSTTCQFIRETVRKETSNTEVRTDFSFGGFMSTKAVTKITEYWYEYSLSYTLSAIRGTGVQDADRVTFLQRKCRHDCCVRVKACPFVESSAFEYSVPVTWLMSALTLQDSDKNSAVAVSIDRSSPYCFTPSRNPEVLSWQQHLIELSQWSEHVLQFVRENSINVATRHHITEEPQPDYDLPLSLENTLVVPIYPVFREREGDDAIVSRDNVVGAIIAPSSTTTVAVAAAPTQRATLLSIGDLQQLLRGHMDTLSKLQHDLTSRLPAPASALLFSSQEAQLMFVSQHLTHISEVYSDSIALLENMLRRQLIAAIGKVLTPVDFSAYMDWHYRRLYRPAFRPKPWSQSVRRSEVHAPEGSVRIEMDTSAGMVTTGASNEGFQPLQTFCLSHTVPETSSEQGYMSFGLNASTQVRFGGERHVHAWLGHSFSNGDASASPLRLALSARPFCSYIVLLGRISSASTFDAKHALLVQNTEEVLIPLLLETIPSAKEFREATSSLSPEQRRFAQAYRYMQLESTLFGILIVQVKPALEKVLNLPANALTKEVKLTQDLMKLFVTYHISPDLLSYELDADDLRVTVDQYSASVTRQRVDAVKGHVRRMNELLEEMKQEEVREKQVEREFLQEVLDRDHRKLKEVQRMMASELQNQSALMDELDSRSDTLQLESVSFTKSAARPKGGMLGGWGSGSRGGGGAKKQNRRRLTSDESGGGGGGSGIGGVRQLVAAEDHQGRRGFFGKHKKTSSVAAADPFDDGVAVRDKHVEQKESAVVASAASDCSSASDGGDSGETKPSSQQQQQQTTTSSTTTAPDAVSVSVASTVDFTSYPRMLDEAFDNLQQQEQHAGDRSSSSVRAAILSTGPQWTRRKVRALALQSASSPTAEVQETLGEEEQRRETRAAFDLLDALTAAGALPLQHAALHIVMASTQVCDLSLLDAVIQRNRNPIEDAERASLALTSVLYGSGGATPAVQMIEPAQWTRLAGQEVPRRLLGLPHDE